MSEGYEAEDEYDVARGIVDALKMKHSNETAADWLGWKISDGGMAEVDIEMPDGKRYRATVEAIEDDAI